MNITKSTHVATALAVATMHAAALLAVAYRVVILMGNPVVSRWVDLKLVGHCSLTQNVSSSLVVDHSHIFRSDISSLALVGCINGSAFSRAQTTKLLAF